MYQIQQKVLFQHCDPAGIVFYPRYFEMINATVEQWFSDALEHSFAQMHIAGKVGVPTAAIETQFLAPSYLEDLLDFRLGVKEIGEKSAALSIDIYCQTQLRVRVSLTLVYVDLQGARPLSKVWPAQLRERIQAFRTSLKTSDASGFTTTCLD